MEKCYWLRPLTCGMFSPDAGHEDLLITGTNVVSIKLSPSLTLTVFAAQTEGIQGDSGIERTPRQRHVCMSIFSNTEVSSVPLLIETLRSQGQGG
ncbi:hypothetical protein P692DRAFT_20810233 [Suillus brevipes Sb2]|nr:hypothetical protein P692DRAFT_20810233 [Suillus brevipes Sb2]